MLGADAGSDIAVQVMAPQKRRVAVDVTTLKRLQLGHAACVLEQHTGVIHELGQPDHAGMVHQRDQISGFQPRAGRLHMG